jgi:hypothetical protein
MKPPTMEEVSEVLTKLADSLESSEELLCYERCCDDTCREDGHHQKLIARAREMTRKWSSKDGGRTWAPVHQST